SFSGSLRQTINFPFDDGDWLRRNLAVTRTFLAGVGQCEHWRAGQPMWRDVEWTEILEFLGEYQMDESATQVRAAPMLSYIRGQGRLLVYPISRFSGHGGTADEPDATRVPIFEDPERGVDVIGVALVFPRSQSAASAEFITGPVNADGA